MRAHKKPIVVNVFRWTEEATSNMDIWPYWLAMAHNEGMFLHSLNEKTATIKTSTGEHGCRLSDWIIQGVKGEIYHCEPDIFEQTYDVIEE